MLSDPGDAVLIERGRPRCLLIKCPCGCGSEFPINLDDRSAKAWRLYHHNRSGISLYPSVWRDTDCRSHFIVWRNRIYLFRGDYDEGTRRLVDEDAGRRIRDAVIQRVRRHVYTSYTTIADEILEVPWDVLDVCRRLVQEGYLNEGSGKRRGHFRLTR